MKKEATIPLLFTVYSLVVAESKINKKMQTKYGKSAKLRQEKDKMTKNKNNKTTTKSNTDKLREEFYKSLRELDVRLAKRDAKIEKLLKAQEKTDVQIDKLRESQKETEKLVKELSKNN